MTEALEKKHHRFYLHHIYIPSLHQLHIISTVWEEDATVMLLSSIASPTALWSNSFLFLLFTVLPHLSAVHHWPQPGGLAYRHDQPQDYCHHPGAVSLCYPSCWIILGGGPPCELLFHRSHSISTLCFQPPRRDPDGHGAAVISADVPPLVLGAQSHLAAQQSAAECLLQEHRLTQQYQLHLSLCSQGTDEQTPSTHAASLHPVLLAHCVLDAYTVWEVWSTTETLCNQTDSESH